MAAREVLATKLGYAVAKDGSADMNLWLHRQAMNTGKMTDGLG